MDESIEISSGCILETDIEYGPGSLALTEENVDSSQACAALAFCNDRASFWTYHSISKRCVLTDSKSERRESQGPVSGSTDCADQASRGCQTDLPIVTNIDTTSTGEYLFYSYLKFVILDAIFSNMSKIHIGLQLYLVITKFGYKFVTKFGDKIVTKFGDKFVTKFDN